MLDIDLVINGVRYTCTPSDPDAWAFPVGNDEYPPASWYVATFHDPTGALNGGYKHTGIDINLDVSPWGDVERNMGLSVYAIADGVVEYVTQDWYGVPMIVVKHEHDGAPLYTRYAHITPVVQLYDEVRAGEKLGGFADWRGGDHLHLDMTRTPYTTGWFTSGMLDPITVLKAHLDPAMVDAMAARG